MGSVRPEQYTWLEEPAYATPRDGLQRVFTNWWWVVDKDRRICVFRNFAPQCNMNESIVRNHILPITPGAVDAVQIPLVFIPHNCDGNAY